MTTHFKEKKIAKVFEVERTSDRKKDGWIICADQKVIFPKKNYSPKSGWVHVLDDRTVVAYRNFGKNAGKGKVFKDERRFFNQIALIEQGLQYACMAVATNWDGHDRVKRD